MRGIAGKLIAGDPAGALPLGISLRCRPAAHTSARARQLMPALGISRVTDITRLDRLGLPVFASIRPRGRTLRVHAGKGLTPEAARVGALMEAVEFAVAEHASAAGPDLQLPLETLLARLPGGLRLADFAPQLGAAPAPDDLIAASRCEDVATHKRVLLPAELVLVPCPAGEGPSLFGWSTNGLASGNSLEEATLHGLLEVLERDATAMNRARDASARLANDALPPPLDAWAGRWRQLGIDLVVRFVPNEFGLACFEAFLHEPGSLDVNLALGSALHPDRRVALAQAVSSAAQSRLSTVHGGRDDITRFYAKYLQGDQVARHHDEVRLVAALADPARSIDFEAVPHQAWRSARAALGALLGRLVALGFGQVFRRRMNLDDIGVDLLGLHVVKVIVPRCEMLHASGSRMGPRLLGRVLGHA